MTSKEQIEAYAAEAADKLYEKVGGNAQVIIMVADLDGEGPYMIERRGHALGLTWLLNVGRRILENMLLPNPTISR